MADSKKSRGATVSSRRRKQIRDTTPVQKPKNIKKESDFLMSRIGEARTIIYVHGIGNKPEQSILKCQWDRALFGFDLGERSRLAYWVSREYYPQPEAGTCKSGDLIELEAGPTGKGISLKEHLRDVPMAEERERSGE